MIDKLKRPCLLLVAVVASLLALNAVESQTLFQQPVNKADYSRYTSIEACAAAVQRVSDSVHISEAWDAAIAHDTMPYNPHSEESEKAREVAHFCQSKFTSGATASDMLSQFQIALTAGQDDVARSWLERRLNLISPEDSWQQMVIVTGALHSYLGARPMRLSQAEEWLAVMDTMASVNLENKIRWHGRIAAYARAMMDTVLLRRHVDVMYKFLNAMPDSARNTQAGRSLVYMTVSAETPLLLPILRDSGVVVYTARVFSRFVAASGKTLNPVSAAPVGSIPGPLSGRFWYNRESPETEYPRKGRVSLVLMGVRHDCDMARCANSYRTLDRLIKRFDYAIDIVMVGQTQGFFGLRSPQTPEQEAEAMNEYFLLSKKNPAVMVIEETEFYKRPAPDLRRFNYLTENQQAYSISTPLDRYVIPAPPPTAYVVAPDGTVVYRLSLSNINERELTAVLATLLERHSLEEKSSKSD